MDKKRISREEKESLVLNLYHNQNKTYREITKIVGTYPREIKAILKKADPSRSQSTPSQAYQLFSEGKTVTHVAIALDIRQPQASDLFKEYWLLQQLDQLYEIFQEIKSNIHFFLKLYRQALAAGMNIQDVIRALGIAKNDLRSIEYRYQELIKQADSLVVSNLNAAKTIQDLSEQISDMKRTMSQYESLIIERKLELKNLSVQKNNLQACMTHIRNNSEEYSKIVDTVKREMKGTITDPRQILMLALQSIVESARKDDGKLFALIYNLPTTSSHFPDYSTNEDTYERILLNEAEDLYNEMIKSHMDKAISDTISKSELSLKPEDGLDNIEIEYESERNNDIKKDDLQLGKGQNT